MYIIVWDILIASGIALAQLVITWYGVHVSVSENRIRNAVIIGAIGAVGIGLTIFGAIRSGMAQQALQKQLDAIQRNTEKPQPAPVVNVNAPPVNFPPQEAFVTVIGRSLIQFQISLPVIVNFTTENLSPTVPALNQYGFDQMYFVETEPLGPNKELLVSKAVEEKYYKIFLKSIANERPDNSRTLGPQQNYTSSRFGAPLDKDLEKEIQLGNKAVFHAMEFVWTDAAGQHTNEACEWLQPQSFTPGTSFKSGASEVWHYCHGHNGLRP